MGDRDCVLRFLAFYIQKWENYASNDLNGYLVSTMRKINCMTSEQFAQVEDDFKKAMWAATEIFGNEAFRSPVRQGNSRPAISRSLFDAWSVALARCSKTEIECLIDRRASLKNGLIGLMDDREFVKSIWSSTGTPANIRKRFHAVQELIWSHL